ncbi:MAG: BrnA antitoxin family protein [Elusimicrobiota bacterium]|nr:BrnA antitoxin family protein [Elusimicrobiota bacterium]
MTRNYKKLPEFKNESDEFEFWAKHDAAEFVDMAKSEKVSLPELKPTVKKISMNLPTHLMEQLKMIAHKKGVPYQSLMKIMLTKEVKQELNLGV